MAVRDYRELEVWRKAVELAVICRRITKPFPKDEPFGMTSQLRRAASSVPANIAEGFGREHTQEYVHFLSIARGSLFELGTHLEIAAQDALLDPKTNEELRA